MSANANSLDAVASWLKDPIPNLFDKYGGADALKPVVTDYCTRVMSSPATRRCYGSTALPQVIEHAFALLSLILGKPVDGYDFGPMKHVFESQQITRHAYEEMLAAMRQALLKGGFVSRDASIAINVLDIYAEPVFGIKPVRKVSSPFSGVDRRKRARPPANNSPYSEGADNP